MVRLQLPPAPPLLADRRRQIGDRGAVPFPISYLLSPISSFFCLPGRLISRTSPFEGDYGGANPSPAATFFSSVQSPKSKVESREPEWLASAIIRQAGR